MWYYDEAGAGLFEADVVNISGKLLPSTGGIGTTIFYVVAAALLLTSTAGLITVRRRKLEA